VGLFSGLFGGGRKPGQPPKRKKEKRPIVDISKRFELRGRTGQGSMSKVFHAYDNKIGRMVCLKILDKVKTAKFEERFHLQGLDKPSEGEVCLALKHENCVTTYEHGLTTQGEPFLVMEWIEGLGLNYLIETKSPQLKGNRVNYLIQLCSAVAYLHSQKFLHRDLCPRNVMVTKEGVVKLIDFGLTIPYTPDFCKPGNRTGTADFLAPEIIKRQTTDHRVDVFALGVTAYEIFTGSLPWERALSSEETLRKHLNVPPREPQQLNPDLDDDISRILSRAISREVTGRFPTVETMKEALEKLDRTDY
jgi:eukaryotic-like serine/threonine-protein kinase